MSLSDISSVARSVLIVEDEAIIAMMLEEYLSALGHQVRGVASSLAEAAALIDALDGEGAVDLAILDCHLGGEEVWPVADRLLAADITVILSSGGSISTLPERFSACPMLQKPYTMAALTEILTHAPASV